MTFVVGRPKGKTRCSKTWRELGDTLVVEGEVICGSRFKDDELLWIEGWMGWEMGVGEYEYGFVVGSGYVCAWRGARGRDSGWRDVPPRPLSARHRLQPRPTHRPGTLFLETSFRLNAARQPGTRAHTPGHARAAAALPSSILPLLCLLFPHIPHESAALCRPHAPPGRRRATQALQDKCHGWLVPVWVCGCGVVWKMH